jgi:hypothetical protein
MEEIQIVVLEKDDNHTRILATYKSKEYKFDISSATPEEDVIKLARDYISIKERLNS